MQSAPISFVITAYNDVDGVRRHLDYFARAAQPAELIIVDDASTDGLGEVAKQASLPDCVTLRYHRNPENLGPGPSRNAGLDLASAELLMFLDADDLLVPEFFDYIALSPLGVGADFVLFKHHLCRGAETRLSYDMHPGDNQFFSALVPCGFPNRVFELAEIPSVLRIVNFPWNKVYRTGFLRGADIRFPDLRLHEDIGPHWQSCLRADRFGILNWAPPLIHHFEVRGAARATNYFGPRRDLAFAALKAVFAEAKTHAMAGRIIPELLALSEDLRAWMVRSDPGRALGYDAAAATLYTDIGYHPGTAPAASEMGQIIL